MEYFGLFSQHAKSLQSLLEPAEQQAQFDFSGLLDVLRTQEFKNYPEQTLEELFILSFCASLRKNHGENLAEIGVYMGGSAELICKSKHHDQTLFLIDTFEGLQDCAPSADGGKIWNGNFTNADAESLALKFINQKVEVIKGYFPDCAPQSFLNKTFSFVHLDVDTYQSTVNCLDYFYSKMDPGGIIVSHDYVNANAPGVKRAFDEFLAEKNVKFLVPGGGSTQIILRV